MWYGILAQVMPTLTQGFSRSPLYLTTRFYYLRTVEQSVLDHVLQRADGYISRFSFRFAPFLSIDRTLTSTSYLRLAHICLFFFDPAFSSPALKMYSSGM